MSRIILILALFSLSLSTHSQIDKRYGVEIEQLLPHYIDLFNKYIALDCLINHSDTSKVLLLNVHLYNSKYYNTNFEEDFIDSLRQIIENNWFVDDKSMDLKGFYIDISHYYQLNKHDSTYIYKKYFDNHGSWNNKEFSLEETRAAVTILIERGYSVYLTSFSAFHIYVPPE